MNEGKLRLWDCAWCGRRHDAAEQEPLRVRRRARYISYYCSQEHADLGERLSRAATDHAAGRVEVSQTHQEAE